MNVYWNSLKLQHPPYSTWRTHQNAFDVKTFLATIDKAIREIDSMNILDIEAAFLSRLIYRMKNKFRNDKGLKSMEKVNKALIIYLNIALVQDYKILKSYIYKEDKMVTLPSKQLLEYILVRTQGFAKLIERLEQVARYSAHFLKMRIKLGHAWSISLIAYAIISRIWFLSRQLLRKCCIWYKELYQYIDKLQYVGLPWIPKNQFLPCDLEQWLSVNWMHTEKIGIYHNNNWEDTIFKLLKEHSDDCGEVAATITELGLITHNSTDTLQKNISNHNILENKLISCTDINDIEEMVSRKTFETNLPKMCENDAGTPLIRKRKRSSTNNDIKTLEKLKKKRKKQRTMSEDIIKIKSDRNNG